MADNLKDRLPVLINMIRQVKAAVAQASIECRPNDKANRDRWFKPFEEIRNDLDKIEEKIRIKLRENE